MYERRHVPPLSGTQFTWRLVRHVIAAVVVLGVSLLAGMVGYMRLEALSASDAFLEAAMLLGGMGPVHAPESEAGKLFAGLYALYAGVVFLAVTGIVLAPVVHRGLHRFHWDRDA